MRTVATWILTVLLALAFLGAGGSKLASQPMMIATFNGFGYPQWFMYVTGVIEIAGAVLVLVPRVAFIGAALLVCVMVGAIFSHLTHGQAAKVPLPLVLLALAVAVGTLRGWRPAQPASQT
jgi:putative oxidoreductase